MSRIRSRANSSSTSSKESILAETEKGPTAADLFRFAQAIRKENPQASYKEIASQIVRKFSGGPLPPTYNLTIPEQDARAPEGTHDKWHDRSKGVAGATAKGIGKWMPEELVKLAERNVHNREK